MRVTQKSFCKENTPCQNMLWQGVLVLKVGFWVSPMCHVVAGSSSFALALSIHLYHSFTRQR